MPASACLCLAEAAPLLQRFGDLLVIGIVAAMALAGARHGLFLATLWGMQALAALVAALAFGESVAEVLVLAEVPAEYTLIGGYAIVFLAVGLAIRLAIGAKVTEDVLHFPPLFETGGGLLVGALGGVVLAGAVQIALSMTPLPPTLRLDASKLRFDMGAKMLRTFVRCMAATEQERTVLLDGEPGTAPDPEKLQAPYPPPGGVRRPQWSEPFADLDGNGAFSAGEPFADSDGDGAFTPILTGNDLNANDQRDLGLMERYRLGSWLAVKVLLRPDDPKPAEPAPASSSGAEAPEN